ncbi:MAG: GAF domain-containing protein [Anaerolineae bacterium]|nr:GAF domain-containing protein [Anaerolineae bacterium]
MLTAEHEQRLLAETLTEATLAITSQTNLNAVLNEILRQIKRLIPYRAAHIMLLEGNQLRIGSWQGYRVFDSEKHISNLVQPLANFPLEVEAIQTKNPIIISDTRRERRWVVHQETAWVRSHVVLPIFLGDHVFGLLRLDSEKVNMFSTKDLIKLQPLANAAAIALENARLFDKAQQEILERKQAEQALQYHNQQLAQLNKASQTFISTLDLDQVLTALLQEVCDLLNITGGSVWLIDADTNELVCRQATNPEMEIARLRRLPYGQGIVGWVVQNGESLIVSDTRTDQRHYKGIDEQLGIEMRSILSVPLRIKQRVIGVLQAVDTQPNRFVAKDQALLEPLAVTAAIAVENARLFEQAQREIAERKRAEEELQLRNRQMQRLTTAIEQSVESVIITDTKGIIVYVNSAFERITGYSRAEAVNQKLSELIRSGKQDDAVYREIWSTISAGKVWHGRLINRKKDGTFYTDEAVISPVRNEDGHIINYVSVQRDVTREIQLEEQYHQAQKMQAVGLLAGGVAHDFNNLLTPIRGYAEMIEIELPEEHSELKELAHKIQEVSLQAATMVKQLLIFSRKQITTPKIVSLNDIVDNISQLLERLIEEYIEVKTNLSSELWAVKADPTQIEQVIVNLAVNARDAMPEGGKLTIETKNSVIDDSYTADHLEVEQGEYVQLIVSDTGIGMSKELQRRIFEPFFTTKEKGKGTGLGLATVFGIIKQNGGHIWVYSELGQGTTFKVYLPRATERVSNSTLTKRSVKNLVGGNETILIVEDEPSVRNLAKFVLKKQGYKILEASNGVEALRITREYNDEIHLLLTDTVMPKMSGQVLVEQFKIVRPDTKILLTSGYTGKRNNHSDKSVNSDIAFIQKPFSAVELVQMIRDVLDSEKQ